MLEWEGQTMDVYARCRDELAAGRNPVLVSGYARLPDAVASHSQFDRIGVVLVVDRDTGEVIGAEPTLLTTLAKDFFRALTEGTNLYQDPAGVLARIERHYHGGTGPALVTAFRKCLERLTTLRSDQAAGAERAGGRQR